VPGAPADAAGGTTTFNGQRANQNNFTVDGQTVTDSGVNQQFAYRINVDAIGEFKVSTTSQGAEYGRNSGAQVQVATKTGTQAFHGGGYFFKRHEGWNANSFDNNRRNVPRQIYRFMTAGYNVGGPVFIPDTFNTAKDKLFFFMSHEWNGQLVPPVPRRVRVPHTRRTARRLFRFHGRCGSSCHHQGSADGPALPGQHHPAEPFQPLRSSSPELVAATQFDGNTQHNYESQVAQDLPSFDQVYRFDYNINSNWKASARILHSSQTQNNPYGRADSANNLGLSPLYAPTFGKSISGNLTTIISPTMTNEFQAGWTKNGIPVMRLPRVVRIIGPSRTSISRSSTQTQIRSD
jgi:hypothetical protein